MNTTLEKSVGGSVEVENLTKKYGDIIAVEGVDLKIHSGEFLTLLGPSGCGKSTTLRMISGLETPTDGTVYISGEDVTTTPANDRNTSLVFQEWALFPHMTVGENVSFGLEMDNVPKPEREDRVADVLELVELPGTQERNANELSGGQKQRVAMARALVREPDVLLLDEPLASLDRSLRQQMQVELKQIQEDIGVTFIYVTHDQEEALTMSDRIAVMNEGGLEQIGEPSEIYEHPNSEFVANFMGETNLLKGSAQRDGDDVIVLTPNDEISLGDVSVTDGESLTLTIRPERISVVAANETLPYENTWTGTVTEAIYKGSIIQYNVAKSGKTYHVENQLDEQMAQFSAGDEVTFGFPIKAIEIIRE